VSDAGSDNKTDDHTMGMKTHDDGLVVPILNTHGDSRTAARDALIERIVKHDETDGMPFYVVDLATVKRQHDQWTRLLPRVEPFYAVKCNNDQVVLDALNAMGTGFDCASAGELKQVLAMGVSPENIIYANPCKQISHLQFARGAGVRKMTFDCKDELVKIQASYPTAELVIRVLVDDSYSVCKLGTKYGAPASETYELLEFAQKLGLNVIGVSFHVGSGCQSARAYSSAIKTAAQVFAEGEDLGFVFKLLDIGGGFPGTEDRVKAPVLFHEIIPELNEALDDHFPVRHGVRIIAEPGRYMVCASHTEATPVISRRIMYEAPKAGEEKEEVVSYYINDGVYGSFNCTLYDHVEVYPLVLRAAKETVGAPLLTSCIWGPTCDSMDRVVRRVDLPKLDVGDWLYFEDMGAYTCAASSTFNGFQRPIMYYMYSTSNAEDFKTLPAKFPKFSRSAARALGVDEKDR